jgi:N-methylhydantoinase A
VAAHAPVCVGIDIGGTFTDLGLAVGERIVAVSKVLTTPDDPSDAVLRGFLETLALAELEGSDAASVIHGTTLVANALIERKGAETALITNDGFRDVIEIGRERRYDLYDLMLELPRPLVPRHLRLGVRGRLLADGTELEPLDLAGVEQLAIELEQAGVEAVAVAFLHSYANAEHEQAALGTIRRAAPSLDVSISSEVVPESGEYPRTSTTIANVYVQRLTRTYLLRLVERLRATGFAGTLHVMLSNGGLSTVSTATRFPVRLLESGPAAGAIAAAAYGSLLGRPDLVSFDMGGTTAKLCVIEEGRPLVTDEFEVDRKYRLKRGSGLPVKLSVIDMIEIGAGGGSIAWIDSLGLMKVGPESAGAEPGPAAYGRGGTRPTVTDADLVLGYLDPDYFLGGQMRLDVDAAAAAIGQHVAEPLGLTVPEAAWGIYRLVNESMASAAQMHAIERGKDASTLPLFAFGGAGPVHATGVAAALRSASVVVPPRAGVMSSLGFLLAPLAFDFGRTWRARLDTLDLDEAHRLLGELGAQGRAILAASGVPERDVRHVRVAEMRYVGQGYQIRVELGATITRAELHAGFDRAYRRRFRREGPPVPVEVVGWRVLSTGPVPELDLGSFDVGEGAPSQRGSRPVYFGPAAGYVDTAVYDRYALPVGTPISGPAIVEERESTIVIGPPQQAVVAAGGCVVVSAA